MNITDKMYRNALNRQLFLSHVGPKLPQPSPRTCAISLLSSLLEPLDYLHVHWSFSSNHQFTPVSIAQTSLLGMLQIRPWLHLTCGTSFLLLFVFFISLYHVLARHLPRHRRLADRVCSAGVVWGMCSAADHARLDSLLRRSKRLAYCSDDLPAVDDLFSAADDQIFRRIRSNSNHVLHPYLPGETDIPYQLRTRSHRMTLINKTKFLDDADFIIRLLYKHSY